MNFLLQSFQISSPNSLIFIIPICLFLFGLVFFRWLQRLPYPPGPKGLPIIGNMLMMDQLTHRGLAKLSEQYGGIFHLRLGFAHMVVVSSPDVARQFLQVHDTVFSNRHASTAVNYLTYDRADMAFAHCGPFWLQMRKLFVTKLFNRKRKIVKDEVDSAVRAVMGRTGNAVDIGELVFSLTRNVIYRAAFGRSLKEGQDEFIGILHEFLKLFGEFNITDFIPYLGWIDPLGINNRLVKARESLDKFMDVIIDDHIEKKKMEELNDGETDMVNDLLPFYNEEAKVNESADGSIKLTRDNIKALIMDVTFGGTETVASAIEWAMAELMRTPDELKKVQRELADVVGLDRRPEEGDFEKLTYLKCALKETLRLHPPIPLLLHETSEAAEVAGRHIPKKSRVMINAWAIGRDKDSWEDPESFKPSRFLKEGAPDFKGSNFEFIPFGSGRRSCPGMHLGLYVLELAVAHLIHCFAWELPNGMKPSELDMNDAFGVTAPRASRLIGVASRRVVCPL